MWKLLEPRSTAARMSGTDFEACRATCRVSRSGRERRAAAAGGLRVRIADDELRSVEPFAVVDFRAGEVLDAHRIDEQLDAEVLDAGVAVLFLLVEFETVLHARAPASLHEHAQLEVGVSFSLDEVADLAGGGIGEGQRFCLVDHAGHTTRGTLRPQPRGRTRLAFPPPRSR